MKITRRSLDTSKNQSRVCFVSADGTWRLGRGRRIWGGNVTVSMWTLQSMVTLHKSATVWWLVLYRDYSIHRVPEFLSLRRNLVPPPHPPQVIVSPPSLGPGGYNSHKPHSLSREGVKGPISDDGTCKDILVPVLYVHYNPSMPLLRFLSSHVL